ncbi:hypothetical protein RHSIM_Rhsim01G0118400 [Rhododendron simsii]|uniref:Uncharacterized protein n=1 Tax=Rhododendron simsii TaxID=118357 RepID=A0A834HHY1_RHOSS|nr:hypothetical protein RHSIM_Rhsim01G0118400 [Rhododendron simsii]
MTGYPDHPPLLFFHSSFLSFPPRWQPLGKTPWWENPSLLQSKHRSETHHSIKLSAHFFGARTPPRAQPRVEPP